MSEEKIGSGVKFDHTKVYKEEIEPAMDKIGKICEEARMNMFTMFEVMADLDADKAITSGGMNVNNPEFMSFPFYLATRIAKDLDFVDRIEKIMPLLQLSDEEFLKRMLMPEVPQFIMPPAKGLN